MSTSAKHDNLVARGTTVKITWMYSRAGPGVRICLTAPEGPGILRHVADDTNRAKRALRAQLLERRQGMDPEVIRVASCRIQERLLGLPACQEARAIHCYVDGLPNEVGTRRFLQWCLDRDRSLVLPVVVGPRPPMRHARIGNLGELVPGRWGIPEPPVRPDTEVAASEPHDLIVVPGVAFDEGGYRIGHGGGFYDDFLRHQSAALKVGVVYEELLLAAVPTEAHDMPVDLIVTESRLHTCSPAGDAGG